MTSSRPNRFWISTIGGLLVALSLSVVVSEPAQAITKSDVEQACASSRQAYDTYQNSRASFLKATEDLEGANWALVEAESKEQRIRSQYESNQLAREELAPQVEHQAVDLYMQAAGSGTAGLTALSEPEDALVAFEFMSATTESSVEGLTDLHAITAELDRLGGDLEAVVDEKTDLRDAQRELTEDQESAMNSALDSYEELTDECKELQADYEAEQARLRAEEEARKRREAEAKARAAAGGGGNSSGRSIDGIICPFTPGRTQFGNTFGAPRSGGRSHRGTDMFARVDEPIYAVESGVASTDDYGLGGKQIFLRADSGRAYYYAHLNGFNIADGSRVNQGDLIGFNGNSGNAAGTSPHLHFQIYANGSGNGIINPYFSVASVCF